MVCSSLSRAIAFERLNSPKCFFANIDNTITIMALKIIDKLKKEMPASSAVWAAMTHTAKTVIKILKSVLINNSLECIGSIISKANPRVSSDNYNCGYCVHRDFLGSWIQHRTSVSHHPARFVLSAPGCIFSLE